MHEYYSMTMRHSSEKPHGSRNIVSIKNGRGFKQVDVLNEKGNVVHTAKRNLSADEINRVTKGNFVPGFWKNCANGASKKLRTRKNKRM